jgi:hypothetical protein
MNLCPYRRRNPFSVSAKSVNIVMGLGPGVLKCHVSFLACRGWVSTAGSKAAGKRSDIVFRKSKEKATRLRAGRSLKGFPASGLPANVEADRDTDS